MNKLLQLSILFLLSFVVSCANQQQEKQNSNTDTTIVMDNNEPLIVLTQAQKEVDKDSKELIRWYIENKDSLFHKRELIVAIDDKGRYYIDLDMLDDYISFIKANGANYLSANFVQAENSYWQKIYNETKKEPVVSDDGPDPWSYDFDPIFMGQDWPSSYKEWLESWQNPEYLSIEIEGDSAKYNNSATLNLIKENGRWKLKSWD